MNVVLEANDVIPYSAENGRDFQQPEWLIWPHTAYCTNMYYFILCVSIDDKSHYLQFSFCRSLTVYYTQHTERKRYG